MLNLIFIDKKNHEDKISILIYTLFKVEGTK